ncbi:MAG: hypothetical protein Q9166_003048 [cf. Caloplaca sp. 2 TL-2023]
MDEPDAEYAPKSPDLSAYHSSSYQPQHHQHSYPQQPYPQDIHDTHLDSHSNLYSYGSSMHQPYQAKQYPGMAQNGQNDVEWTPESPLSRENRKGKNAKSKVEEDCGKPAPGVEEGIKVATKFPVARIKRIMQADEDIGKVAQVTPIAVSKALELFMISVVTKAANEAKSRSSKRVTAAHLKNAVEKDEQFDFLAEIVSKVPDAPAPKKEGSEEPMEGKKKRAAGGTGGGGGTRRKKKTDDDDL